MEWLQQYVTAGDGLRLGYRIYDARAGSDGLPLVCLPGLTRNARDFHEIAETIAEDSEKPRRVIAIDYRGRGSSQRATDPATYTPVVEAQDLLTVLDSCGIDKAAFIGTSRGGLILHVLTGLAPQRISAVILNDIGPELGVEGLRQIQAYLRSPVWPTSWAEAEALLKSLHGTDFPALAEADWRTLAHAVYAEREGGLEPDCDPAIAEGFASLDLTQPLPALWPQFDAFPDVPMMMIRGAHSKLLTPETVARMTEHRPSLTVITASGQGHAPLLHLGDLPAAIRTFLYQAN
ncbi:pimeloyl-ACP methyl ester carboxylesterase [Neorhizobium galegae]|uniref:alpha/beta fold hydrolase n=1 Tax=Neorhizobium galegae TaxID=399 RepID=UPI001AEB9465|nr:alpha/beta hydrolase [Neorhizobium galegae]MBP2547457.1 pimeloyl-ACP methyl ester carboxylesterase [Neorhizobium galegae]